MVWACSVNLCQVIWLSKPMWKNVKLLSCRASIHSLYRIEGQSLDELYRYCCLKSSYLVLCGYQFFSPSFFFFYQQNSISFLIVHITKALGFSVSFFLCFLNPNWLRSKSTLCRFAFAVDFSLKKENKKRHISSFIRSPAALHMVRMGII